MTTVHHRASGWSFHIAPVLDRGWGYDPYVAHLVGRIKAGRPALQSMFDCNSLFLGSGHDTELQRYAAKKREISAQEMLDYRADQEKRRLATEAVYAQQRADAEARRLEEKREEQAWRAKRAAAIKTLEDRAKEWADAKPPRSHGVRIPIAGWWRKEGDDVVVVVMLHASNSTQVLVGPEGAGLWIEKWQVKLVKGYTGGVHELTLDGAFAKRVGLCKGKPTRWTS